MMTASPRAVVMTPSLRTAALPTQPCQPRDGCAERISRRCKTRARGRRRRLPYRSGPPDVDVRVGRFAYTVHMTSRLSRTATSDAGMGRFDLRAAVAGRTFDDFLFSPQLGVLERRDPARIDLSCPLTARITLARPFLSANMDTVTRGPDGHPSGRGRRDRGHRPRIPAGGYRCSDPRGGDGQADAARDHPGPLHRRAVGDADRGRCPDEPLGRRHAGGCRWTAQAAWAADRARPSGS